MVGVGADADILVGADTLWCQTHDRGEDAQFSHSKPKVSCGLRTVVGDGGRSRWRQYLIYQNPIFNIHRWVREGPCGPGGPGGRRQIQVDLDQVEQVEQVGQVGEGRSRWKQMIPAPNADLLPSMG